MDAELDAHSALKKLIHYARILESNPHRPESHLRDYVSIYIEWHTRSDEFFTTLCEHKFMQVMLEQEHPPASPTCYLENLNLLLANTKIPSELVYFLSQTCLHTYLFGEGVLGQGGEFVEYYIQLLKTILLKISENEENRSFIKLFCNNKYPSFPILNNCSILASDNNELVRVTAQQCVLIIVGMLNERQQYTGYLCEMPMLSFFAQVACEYLNPAADHEGVAKFIADLLYELRRNSVPLLLLNNIVCNVIFIQNLPHAYHIPLKFAEELTAALSLRIADHKASQQQSERAKRPKYAKPTSSRIFRKSSQKYESMIDKNLHDDLALICAAYYRIIIKYLTSRYLNSCYVSNGISLASPVRFPILGLQAQSKLFREYLPQSYLEEQSKSEVNLVADPLDEIEEKLSEFNLCKDFIKIKENHSKKAPPAKNPSGGFFGNFFKKITHDNTPQWLNALQDLSSIKFVKGGMLKDNFPHCLTPNNCAFISEFTFLKKGINCGRVKLEGLKLNQDSDDTEPDEINFNEMRDQWVFNEAGLNCIEKVTVRYIEYLHDGEHTITLPKLGTPPEYFFIVQLKEYLGLNIHKHFSSKSSKNRPFLSDYLLLIKMARIVTGLNPKLSENAYLGMGQELRALHQGLQALIFESGFDEAVAYLHFKVNRSKKDTGSEQAPPQKPGRMFQKLCQFEVMQRIMNPGIRSFGRCFELAWKELHKNCIDGLPFYEFQVNYFGKNGCRLVFVVSQNPPTIFMRVELYGKIMQSIDVMEVNELRHNNINKQIVQIGNSIETVTASCHSEAQAIMSKFVESKQRIEEAVGAATMEYLSITHEMLVKSSKEPPQFKGPAVTPE